MDRRDVANSPVTGEALVSHEPTFGVVCLVLGCQQPVFGVASAVNKFCPGHRAEEVRREWERCPRCGDTRLEGDNVEIGTIHAWQAVDCLACHASWTETYTASSRSNYEEGDMG